MKAKRANKRRWWEGRGGSVCTVVRTDEKLKQQKWIPYENNWSKHKRRQTKKRRKRRWWWTLEYKSLTTSRALKGAPSVKVKETALRYGRNRTRPRPFRQRHRRRRRRAIILFIILIIRYFQEWWLLHERPPMEYLLSVKSTRRSHRALWMLVRHVIWDDHRLWHRRFTPWRRE